MSTTTHHLAPDDIAEAFVAACEAELQALKPGNVHVFAPGHDMDVRHFKSAARAAAPHIADPEKSVGLRIHDAVKASLGAAGCNTNLGIVLLCVPLAAAAQMETRSNTLRQRLAKSLAQLNGSDAAHLFAAIRLANPGGLGAAETGDVTKPGPNLSILDAMRIAAHFDRIAKAYTSDFDDLFSHHLARLGESQMALRAMGAEDASSAPRVLTALYMRMLADFPDSHIIRKFGRHEAEAVQTEALALEPHWWPVYNPAKSQPTLIDFDTRLKENGLNPGTTADFVVATLFAAAILDRLPQPKV